MVTRSSDESMNSLLNEMRPFLIISGVAKEQIRIRSGKHHTETLSKAFDWLHDLKLSNQYTDLVATRRLLPELTWEHYELFQIEGLKEQELLEKASKRLLKKWKSKRPPLFGKDRKKRKNDKKT